MSTQATTKLQLSENLSILHDGTIITQNGLTPVQAADELMNNPDPMRSCIAALIKNGYNKIDELETQVESRNFALSTTLISLQDTIEGLDK